MYVSGIWLVHYCPNHVAYDNTIPGACLVVFLQLCVNYHTGRDYGEVIVNMGIVTNGVSILLEVINEVINISVKSQPAFDCSFMLILISPNKTGWHTITMLNGTNV